MCWVFDRRSGAISVRKRSAPARMRGADSVILSDRLWRGRFGASASIIGNRVTLGRKPFVVIGVLPPAFNTFTGSGETDVWTTLAGSERVWPGMKRPLNEERGISNLNVIGRLKPGVSLERARADMGRVAALLERNYPADNPHEGVAIREPAERGYRPSSPHARGLAVGRGRSFVDCVRRC